MNGIQGILKENPQINLNITETTNPSYFNAPIFAHSDVGKNEDPESKIDDFADILQERIGEEVDIAFLKFCFADILSTTNTDKIFNDYNKMICHQLFWIPCLIN